MSLRPFLPPSRELCATLNSAAFDPRYFRHLPAVEAEDGASGSAPRRQFLQAVALAPLFALEANAKQLIFSPGDSPPSAPSSEPQPQLQLGEIPSDFWLRPRELWLTRRSTGESIRAVYWKDGHLQPEGYWQICAILRDVRANRMTHMDPTLLDVLRGILGFYQAWNWNQPLVVTSGFRTQQTNRALGEGAAKNSLHLHGRAVDLFMPGIPPRDIGALAFHMQRGGVGFYPSRGFTHIDTGRLRTWRG